MESIAVHSVWNAARLHADPKLRQCKRCGEGVETLMHRYWECKGNANIQEEDVQKTQKLCGQAKLHWEDRGSCFWNGGLLQHNLRAGKARCVVEAEAKAKTEHNLVEAMEREGLVATDGAGGAVGARSERHRVVGAGAAVVTFNEEKNRRG